MDYNSLYQQIHDLERDRRQEELKLLEEQTKHDRTRKEIEKVANEIKQREQEEVSLKAKLTDCITQEKETKKTLEQLRSAVKGVKQENDLFESFVHQKKSELRQKRTEMNEQLNGMKQSLTKCIQQWESKKETQKLVALQQEIHRLREEEKEFQLSNQRNSNLTAELQAAEAENQQLQKSIEELSHHAQLVRQNVNSKSALVEELTQQIEQMKHKRVHSQTAGNASEEERTDSLEKSAEEEEVQPEETVASAADSQTPDEEVEGKIKQLQEELKTMEQNHANQANELKTSIKNLSTMLEEQSINEEELVTQGYQIEQLLSSLKESYDKKICSECLANGKQQVSG